MYPKVEITDIATLCEAFYRGQLHWTEFADRVFPFVVMAVERAGLTAAAAHFIEPDYFGAGLDLDSRWQVIIVVDGERLDAIKLARLLRLRTTFSLGGRPWNVFVVTRIRGFELRGDD